jgi:hypothetical protein
MLTIIKQRPERRGLIRTFEITQIINGRRQHITMLAKSYREVTGNLLAAHHQPQRVAA